MHCGSHRAPPPSPTTGGTSELIRTTLPWTAPSVARTEQSRAFVGSQTTPSGMRRDRGGQHHGAAVGAHRDAAAVACAELGSGRRR